MSGNVIARTEKLSLPTYRTAAYETLPMFAENRIHQRVSGNPYPNPIINQVLSDGKEEKEYTAIRLENDYIEVIILPELGGKIFTARDKTNGYDFFYRQHVIKPALIGMLGLWTSGGVEFNWPIHHRPSTFLPTDYAIVHESNGATVYLSEHEPLNRMKGMVAIHLDQDKAMIETRVQLYNRSDMPNSFLFWENAAVPVNKNYRIFFPPDVSYVNFHYKKARGGYPVMDEYFNTQDNRGGKDIRFHRNTENATSYFCGPTKFDFFGGYDEGKKAGVLHYASHYTSIGKKMFTWGYRRMESSWESALTDTDGAYAELMASSYSDNQPDLTWIEGGENRSFSQYWYPFKDIGEVLQASLHGAVSCNNGRLGIYPVETIPNARIMVSHEGKQLVDTTKTLSATIPVFIPLPEISKECTITIRDEKGTIILSYAPVKNSAYVPDPWKDNPSPEDIEDAETCYLCGLHVEQYRDPLINGIPYWERGIALDHDNADCLKSLGMAMLKRLDYEKAEEYLKRAIGSLTRYNPHPRDTEAFHLLALALLGQGKDDEAFDNEEKALWNQKTQFQAYRVLIRILCKKQKWDDAIQMIHQALELTGYQQEEAVLEAVCERKLGHTSQAEFLLQKVLQKDPLDDFARYESAILHGTTYHAESNEDQIAIDISIQYADAGLDEEACTVLGHSSHNPMVLYLKGFFSQDVSWYAKASKLPETYCFPSRQKEKEALESALRYNKADCKASLYLGDLLYGICKNANGAIACWQNAGNDVQALRNLSIAYFNKDNSNKNVIPLLEKAINLEPDHLQLLYERLLAGEMQGENPDARYTLWHEKVFGTQGEQRDDLFLLGVKAANEAGKWSEALSLLEHHHFIPCEGGEHAISNEYLFASEALGLQGLAQGKTKEALAWFQKAQTIPENLGGGVWHPVMLTPYQYLEGICLTTLERKEEAAACWEKIDDYPLNYFTRMYLPSFPIWKGMAEMKLGKLQKGTKLCREAFDEAEKAMHRHEYGPFAATPFFNSFQENPSISRKRQFLTLQGIALEALGEKEKAMQAFSTVVNSVPCHKEAGLYLRFPLP